MADMQVIDWPQATPVCLLVEEDDAGEVRNRWLQAAPTYHDKNANDTYYRPLRAELDRRNDLTSFWIESVGAPRSRMVRIRAKRPASDSLESPAAENPDHPFGWHLRVAKSSERDKNAFGGWNLAVDDGRGDWSKFDDDPEHDPRVFTYVVLEPADDGRKRVAFRDFRGRYLRLSRGRHVIGPDGASSESHGVSFVVDEPLSQRKVVIVEYTANIDPHEVAPAVAYHTHLVNPTSKELVKEFTFTHAKETVGTWNSEVGASLSVGASVTVGAEVLGAGVEATAHWELTASYNHSWGGSEAERQTVEDSTTITVPEYSALDADITTRRQESGFRFKYIIGRWDLAGEQLPPANGDPKIEAHHRWVNGDLDPEHPIAIDDIDPSLVYDGVYRKVETLDSEVILTVTSAEDSSKGAAVRERGKKK